MEVDKINIPSYNVGQITEEGIIAIGSVSNGLGTSNIYTSPTADIISQ